MPEMCSPRKIGSRSKPTGSGISERRLGGGHDLQKQTIGSHVESVVRAVQTPILMATGKFSKPGNYMLAYDGSETADRAMDRIANSPLLSGLPGHVVMVGNDCQQNRQRLQRACDLLASHGHQVQSHLLQGNVIYKAQE